MIKITNFTKSFGTTHVIKDLSFEVKTGEIFAFLGANGAGKTTTIRTLLGIYQPDSGELMIDGKKYDQSMASDLGYLPEERGLYLDLTAFDTLVYFARLKGLEKNDAEKKADEYLKRVELENRRNLIVKNLSSGQQQKIQLGITIINEPKLLILDEPTKGLDPVNRQLLLEILVDMNKRLGTTIMFSTHLLDEVDKIADSVLIIKEGQSALSGNVKEVKRAAGGNKIYVEFDGKFPETLEGIAVEDKIDNHAVLNPDKDDFNLGKILKALIDSNINVTKFELLNPSLEDIFINVAQSK